MTGSLVPLRVVVFMAAIIIGVSYWPLRLIQIDKFSYGCYSGKSISAGEAWIQLGQVSLHGLKYDCPEKDRYNPKLTKPATSADPKYIPDPLSN